MARKVTSRPSDKRYLGNSSPTKMEVHDLENEKQQCQINKVIAAGHAVVFTPNSLSQAHSEGYDNCAYCIGASKR